MKIKNYTSSVPAERTISRIEALLAQAGAASVQKDYKAGEVSALSFSLRAAEGQWLAIRMPVDVPAAYRVLLAARKGKPTEAAARELLAQARRTAWKLMQDWLEVQLSLIQMGQAEAAQVFLPYAVSREGQTLYQLLKGGGFPQLAHRKEQP